MADNKIHDAIGDYTASGQSGTIMAVFDDNSMGRFYLAGGVLVTARYRNKEGAEAMSLAAEKKIANIRFHENADLVRSAQLIDSDPGAVDSVPPSPARAAAAPAGREERPLSHVARLGIGDLLLEYVGPVAPLIMSDLPQGVGLEKALDILSREILDTRQAAQFVQAARKMARNM